MDAKVALLVVLALVTLYYMAVLIMGIGRAEAKGQPVAPTQAGLITGVVTNFFDTLGIGSFAPTTAIFRKWKIVRDEWIPGTLNVGHTLPAFAQAFIFITVVAVGSKTLILMIAAAVAGAWIGAGVFSRWPRRKIQIGMGVALFAAASIMLYRLVIGDPVGGTEIELYGTKLAIAVSANFVLGILMTIGIGLYAPCMLVISVLGMNPLAAFPIMMGSCAFLMPVASARFLREESFDARASLGLLIGGIPAVLIAVTIVKSLPLDWMRWLVVAVVIYTSITLLRAASREEDPLVARAATEPAV